MVNRRQQIDKIKIKNLQQKEYQLSEQKVKQGQAKDLSS